MIKKAAKKIFMKLGVLKYISKSPDELLKNDIYSTLGFSIDLNHYSFLYRSIPFLKQLKNKSNATFSLNENLQIHIEGLNYFVNSWEELYILNEIYIEGVYNANLDTHYALIDIGMNVGMTSLYFAKQYKCDKIFSYEPFDKTYELAVKNMKLNECSSKIKMFKYGLGFPSRNITLNYSEEYKGSMGVNGLASYIGEKVENINTEIFIDDVASNVIRNLEEYNGQFIMKIDCEGAEYEILDRLDSQKLLDKISLLMIEWHINGPAEIKNILMRNGFNLLSFNEKNEDIGMIYAFNNNKNLFRDN